MEYLDVSNVRSDRSSLFPCLEILEMRSLSNLKGWWREAGDNAPISTLLCLSRILKVAIDNCPNIMESMPLFGGEIKELRLEKVNGKLMSTPNMSCSFECHQYNKLQVLSLYPIKRLEMLADRFDKTLDFSQVTIN